MHGDGFHPAYHMNKDKWLTVRLDGAHPDDEVKGLIDLSYELTAMKERKKQADERPPGIYIAPYMKKAMRSDRNNYRSCTTASKVIKDKDVLEIARWSRASGKACADAAQPYADDSSMWC